jgi:NADH dehydrogenase
MSKIVIIGGGFGGLMTAKALKGVNDEIVLIDKTNYHLFQPLLYQVATAALSPGDIALPIRAVFSKFKNVKVILDEVVSINRANRKVVLKDGEIGFDYLVIAIGSRHSYFGNDKWETKAPGLKTLGDALSIRERILISLEKAEKENDPEKRRKYLNFVIIGGGPTGVEMAGAIAEIAKKSLMRDFRNLKASDTNIYLIEAMPLVLNNYPQELSLKAQNDLAKMGVELKLGTKVTDVNSNGVNTDKGFFETKNIIWAAGNSVSPLLGSLNTKLDRAGRVYVKKDMSIEGDPNIFVIGDAALSFDEKGKQLPGVAPVAIQQGRYVGKIIKDKIQPENRKFFHYVDKGNLATIGRAKAVADIHGLKLSGFIAWAAWCFIHIFFLIGFRNRFRVMAEWAWYYITFRHGIRLIVGKGDNDLM